MFEDRTFERLLDEVLKSVPEEIDTRQGSIFYDAVSGVLLKIGKLYTDLEVVAQLSTIKTATGEMLDTRAAEYAVYRLKPTKAVYRAEFTGKSPKPGERFYYDGLYFKLIEFGEDKQLCFEAEVAGTDYNNVYSGTPAVPVNFIEGMKSSTFGILLESGSDIESDKNFRERLWEKISGPAENGNRQHYKTWCESIDGIGIARIIPLWNGVCTVMAVLIDTEGLPCSSVKVAEVQEYIDPADKGMTAVVNGKTYVVGDGKGNGVANIGAHFTAVAAEAIDINITFAGELTEGITNEQITIEAKEAIAKYIQNLVLTTPENENIVVRISAVGAILSGLKHLLDYNNLQINGKGKNVTSDKLSIPVLREVIVE